MLPGSDRPTPLRPTLLAPWTHWSRCQTRSPRFRMRPHRQTGRCRVPPTRCHRPMLHVPRTQPPRPLTLAHPWTLARGAARSISPAVNTATATATRWPASAADASTIPAAAKPTRTAVAATTARAASRAMNAARTSVGGATKGDLVADLAPLIKRGACSVAMEPSAGAQRSASSTPAHIRRRRPA